MRKVEEVGVVLEILAIAKMTFFSYIFNKKNEVERALEKVRIAIP